jgi:tRNA dimethylallyltransferase
VPHHLLDLLDPAADFSAGDFFEAARAAADDIIAVRAGGGRGAALPLLRRLLRRLLRPAGLTLTQPPLQRGKTPIVVGGTGFYLRWFIHGKPSTPASSPATEAAALARLEQVRAGGVPWCGVRTA